MNSDLAPFRGLLAQDCFAGGQVWAKAACTLNLKEEICARGEARA